MIIINSIRITDGRKCYKAKPVKNTFVKTEDEVEAFADEKGSEFIKAKYPDGLPASRDMQRKPILSEVTSTTVPDKEFMNYLVHEMKFTFISKEIVKLLVGT